MGGCDGKSAGMGCIICVTCLLWVFFVGVGISSFIVPDDIRQLIDETITDCLIQEASDDRSDDCYTNFVSNDYEDAPKRIQKFYYYRVKNVQQILSTTYGEEVPRPELEKVGPYAFRKFHDYGEVQFDADSTYMDYFEYQKWVFDADESCSGCTQDDEITMFNQVFNSLWIMGKGIDKANGIELTPTTLGFPGLNSLATQVTLILKAMGTPSDYVQVQTTLQEFSDSSFLNCTYPNSMTLAPCMQIQGMQVMFHALYATQLMPSLSEQDTYFETHTAKEWFFGYESTILKALFDIENTVMGIPNPFNPSETLPGFGLKSTLELMGITDSMIYIYYNGTTKRDSLDYWHWAREKKFTGKSDKTKINEYQEYQNQTHSYAGWWGEDNVWEWSGIKSGEGIGIGNADLQNERDVNIWVPEVRRPIWFEHYENYKVHGKVDLKKYRIAEYEMLSAENYAENSKWYAYGRNGLVNLTMARGKQPTFMSIPGFQNSEYGWVNDFYKLPEGNEEDIPWVAYEPEYGVAWQVRNAIQFNHVAVSDPSCAFMALGHNPVKQCFDKLEWAKPGNLATAGDPGWFDTTESGWTPGIMVPTVYVIEDGGVTEKNVDDWDSMVIDTRKHMDDWEKYGWIGFILGFAFVLCQAGAIWMCCQNQRLGKEMNWDDTPTAGGGTVQYSIG